MKYLIGSLAAAMAVAGCCNKCTVKDEAAAPKAPAYVHADAIEEGFEPLFGHWSMPKWAGATYMYTVGTDPQTGVRGVVQCIPEKHKKGQGGDIYTKKEYRNFILRFEFVMPENGNNGVGIRMVPGRDSAYWGMCELQLLDDGGSSYYDKTAKKDKLKPYQYTGSVYGVVPAKRDNVGKQCWGKDANFAGGGSYLRRAGMWNFEEIKVVGEEIEVNLNGYVIVKADLSKFKGDGDTPDGKQHPGLHNKKGHIGFLGHGANVKWRNVRVKELPDDAKMSDLAAQPAVADAAGMAEQGYVAYFTGRECELKEMWKGVTNEEKFDNPLVRQKATPAKREMMQKLANLQRDEHWFVKDGTLCFDGFKGGYSLATIRDYGDFELWCDWRTMSVTGDSGLYLRGTPQVQIWDAYNEWHIGSGGLFNNVKNPSSATAIADRHVGDWNRFHVIMRGDKVTVFLNGHKVVDNVTLENYWDRSKPIFASEQIELQCHGDPTQWRNIFIREL